MRGCCSAIAAGVEIVDLTDENGEFLMKMDRMQGLPAGTYKVTISGPVALPPLPSKPVNGTIPPKPPSPPSPVRRTIPARYGRIATSGLTATVKQGENPPFKFDLPKQ